MIGFGGGVGRSPIDRQALRLGFAGAQTMSKSELKTETDFAGHPEAWKKFQALKAADPNYRAHRMSPDAYVGQPGQEILIYRWYAKDLRGVLFNAKDRIIAQQGQGT